MTETNLGRIIGPEGPAGKSAYQYAQDGGFEGSEQEFTEKLATEYPTFSNLREASPVNLLDNSNFTQFIAQAGLGGYHGATVYAGDRWRLVRGSVNGELNSSGNGYTNITITHASGDYCDLTQFTPLYNQIEGEACTVAIEYTDGNKYIANFNVGEVTVPISLGQMDFYSIPKSHFIFRVSNNQTVAIKHAWVVLGTYTEETMPEYRPKGYARELLECQRYYKRVELRGITGFVDNVTTNIVFNLCDIPMRIEPTAVIVASGNAIFYVSDVGSIVLTINTIIGTSGNGTSISFEVQNPGFSIPQYTAVSVFSLAVALNADL